MYRTSDSLSQCMCFHIIMGTLLTVTTVDSGDWEQAGQQILRSVIQGAKLVNTTVVRNDGKNGEPDKQCIYKFVVRFPNEKQASIGCLAFDTGRRPALEHSKLLVYGNGFGKIKVTRPLTRLAPFLYSGSILGDPDSVIYGTVAQGAFVGQIRKDKVVFYIEESIKYLHHNNKSHYIDTKFKQGPASHMPRQILFSSVKNFRKHWASRLKRDSEVWDYAVTGGRPGTFISSELDDNIMEEQYTPAVEMVPNNSTHDKKFDTFAVLSADKNSSAQHDLHGSPLDEHTSAGASDMTGRPRRIAELEKVNVTNTKDDKSESTAKSFKEKSQFRGGILQLLEAEAHRIVRNGMTTSSNESNSTKQGLALGETMKPSNMIIGIREKTVGISENSDEVRFSDEQQRTGAVAVLNGVDTASIRAAVANERTEPNRGGTTSASNNKTEQTTATASIDSSILDSRKRLAAEMDRVLQNRSHQSFMATEDSISEYVSTTLESSADVEKPFYVESEGYDDNVLDELKDAKQIPPASKVQATLTASTTSPSEIQTDDQIRSHQLRDVFGLKGGMIWNLTLACDYDFYSSIGNENIGITIGRLLYLFDLAEWAIRSSDWNEDFLPDNFGFDLRNVAIEIEPGKANDRIEKFKSVAEDTKNSLTIAFSSQSSDDFIIMGSHDDGKTARARCDDKVVAIVSTADATRTGLPDAILVQRILDAILRFMGLDETMRNKCDAAKIKTASDEELSHVTYIDACIRHEISKKVITELGPCSSTATVAYCGNGIIEPGEDCDCGSLETCWASDTGCCNSRGNVMRQCKFTKASECYDPEGMCCDLRSCQRKDLSVDGLTCGSSHICEAPGSSNKTIRQEAATKACGALIAENTAGIYTACENKICQSMECSRLGLNECSCIERNKQDSEYGDHCETCCQLHGNVCVTAIGATSSTFIAVKQSYQKYLQENFLLHNMPTFQEYLDTNSTLRRIYSSLQVSKTERGEQTLVSPLDFKAISKEFCAVNGDPNTCLNTSFLHWPEGGPCVVQGAVSICDERRICRMTYQAVATTRDELGTRRNQAQDYKDHPNSGIQQIIMRLPGPILSALLSMYELYGGHNAMTL